VFLDEIQNVDGWPVVLRRFLDTRDIKFFITGSSARLLGKEIATSLRGRSIACEILPFSYEEFLAANSYPLPQAMMGPAARDKGRQHLEQYLENGGFPETIGLEERIRVQMLQDYVNVVVFRDIIERHKISNVFLMKYLIKTLLSSAGKNFTVNKFYNDLRSQGEKIGRSTIYEYLEYVEDAFLAFTVPLFSESLRKRRTNPRKVYAIDPGLVTAYTYAFGRNTGQLFENVVYLALRRKGYRLAYYVTRSGYEIDFVAQDITGKAVLYQVASDLGDRETRDRELRALREAEEELQLESRMVSMDDFVTEPF
jgi:predicted AAA+ superfamily ATPase